MTYKFHQYYISERMMDSIERYTTFHIRPEGFLQAVICNDLKEAIGRADDENMANLPAYIAYFYNDAPASCWGSKENMKLWLAQRKEVKEDE